MSEHTPSVEKEHIDPEMFWDVIWQRDDYRGRVFATVPRIEDDARTSRVMDDQGNVVALQIPIEVWREIRSMLQREHVSRPPGHGDAP